MVSTLQKRKSMNRTHLICIFCLLLPALLITCTKTETRRNDRAVELIKELCLFYEPNPAHQETARSLNALFHSVLEKRNSLQDRERENICGKTYTLCNSDDEAIIEDAVDEQRVLMKDSICMAIYAMISEPREALEYFSDAKLLLTRRDGSINEYMEDYYSGLLILEILYLSDHGMLAPEHKSTAMNAIRNLSTLDKEKRKALLDVLQAF
jgi:hypothetical protein